MKNRKKKDKTILDQPSTDMLESSMIELAEAVIEGLKQENLKGLEPFETYSNRLRGKVHTEPDAFCERFAKGYATLLEELSHEQEEQSKQHPPKSS